MQTLPFVKKLKVLVPVFLLVCFLVVYGNNCGSSPSSTSTAAGAGGATSTTAAPIISMLSSGADHACAVVGSRIQCWGSNSFGQLGNGTLTDSRTGVWVSGISGTITALVSGDFHNCAIVDGAVYCWGYSEAMYPVNGTSTPTPIAIAGWGATDGITALAAGHTATCAIKQEGVQCMGALQLGNLGRNGGYAPDWADGLASGSDVLKIDGSRGTFCITTRSNDLICWGRNDFGNLARGLTSPFEVSPWPVAALGGLPQTSLNALTATNAGTCVQNFAGTYCVGDTNYSYLGTLSSGSYISTMSLSTGLAGDGPLLGGYLNICRLTAGILSCVGHKNYMFADGVTSGISGFSTLTPLTSLGTDVTSATISKYNPFACAVKSARQIVCWGSSNASGQLGNGTTSPSAVPVVVQLAP